MQKYKLQDAQTVTNVTLEKYFFSFSQIFVY